MTNYSHVIQDFEAEKAIEEAKAIIQHKTDDDLITFILDSEHFDATVEISKEYIISTLQYTSFTRDIAEELITKMPHKWWLYETDGYIVIKFLRLNPLK